MKLTSLQLHNFRQFRGTTPEIAFAAPGARSVTVFFGTNGAGKTALLNAFTWTLYAATTRGFLLPEQIVNKASLREAKPEEIIEAWVRIKFEHLGDKFVLRRTQRVRRGATESNVTILGDPITELQWAGPDGQWMQESSIVDAIGRILPIDLHTYFFFDGERIERIVKQDDEERANIANATKKLFSLEVLERAIRHVSSAIRALEGELQKIGDAKTVQLIAEKRTIEDGIGVASERVRELGKNIDGHRKVEEEIQTRLRALRAAREIQKRRDGLLNDKEARVASLKQSRSELSSLISSRSYAVMLSEACKTYLTLVDTMRQRGELPAGIKRQFVADLLARNECICGASLDHNVSPTARATVEKWMGRAGLADVEEKAIRMGGEVKSLELQTSQFWKQLDNFEARRVTDRKELSRIETDLEVISDQLKHSGEEEVTQLEERLSLTKSAIDNDLREQGSCNETIKQRQERLHQIDVELGRHQATEAKQQLAQKRLNAARDVVDRIAESKRRFEAKFRVDLTRKIRTLFDAVSYTPYIPEITEDYSVRLRESAGGMPLPVAASQGESQILSLCFIGAVIALARDYQARKERLQGPDNSQFPIVMDSPFGSLAETYRRQIADHITRLADQVIIMVTNTQWRGEVEQSLRGRIGKAYILQYYSPKRDISSETVEVGPSSYELIKASPNEYEYSIVVEAANA